MPELPEVEVTRRRIAPFLVGRTVSKVRTGPPIDDDEDLAADTWAGLIPVHVGVGIPEPDKLTGDRQVPAHVADWSRKDAEED